MGNANWEKAKFFDWQKWSKLPTGSTVNPKDDDPFAAQKAPPIKEGSVEIRNKSKD
jgi:hypothetical protein